MAKPYRVVRRVVRGRGGYFAEVRTLLGWRHIADDGTAFSMMLPPSAAYAKCWFHASIERAMRAIGQHQRRRAAKGGSR